MTLLPGQTALVTGAAHGIGLALTEALCKQGLRVLASDIDGVAVHKATRQLREQGAHLVCMTLDVTQSEAWTAVADLARQRFGALDLLCSNAGVSVSGRDVDALCELDWRWVIDVNLLGAVLGVAACLPLLRQRTQAHILFTGSMGGFFGAAGNAPYCASKAALMSYAESLSRELQRNREAIGVSLLCPSAVRTTLAESEFRRPARFGRAAAVDSVARAGLARFRAEPLEPHVVAELALAGMRQGQFYIPTHPNAAAVMEQRAADAAAHRQPG